MFVAKDADDNLFEIEGSDLGGSEMIELGAGIGALMGFGAAGEEGANIGYRAGEAVVMENGFGFSLEDMDRIADGIPNNSSGLIMIIEPSWPRTLSNSSLTPTR